MVGRIRIDSAGLMGRMNTTLEKAWNIRSRPRGTRLNGLSAPPRAGRSCDFVGRSFKLVKSLVYVRPVFCVIPPDFVLALTVLAVIMGS